MSLLMNDKHNKRVMALLQECCNFDSGQCLLLDEICVLKGCLTSVLCKYFVNAVLPLNTVLKQYLLEYNGQAATEYIKTCVCGKRFASNSKNKTYCDECASRKAKARCRKYNRERRHHITTKQVKREPGFQDFADLILNEQYDFIQRAEKRILLCGYCGFSVI